MAATRKTPSPDPDHSSAEDADFGERGSAQRHARTDLLVHADTRVKQVTDSIR